MVVPTFSMLNTALTMKFFNIKFGIDIFKPFLLIDLHTIYYSQALVYRNIKLYVV